MEKDGDYKDEEAFTAVDNNFWKSASVVLERVLQEALICHLRTQHSFFDQCLVDIRSRQTIPLCV